MNRKIRRMILAIVFLAITLGPLVWAATTAKTTFVFYVATSRSITTTYGGTCTTNAFFFNETDANFDPDTDGNGAKVRPSPGRRTTVQSDYNYVGINNPSSTHSGRGGYLTSKPPTDNNSPSGEFNNTGYDNIEADDTSYVTRETTTNGEYPAVRLTFKSLVDRGRVRDINFFTNGNSTYAENPQVCLGGSAAAGFDFNTYIWNYQTGQYDYLDGNNMGGATTAADGQVISVTASSRLSGPISNYISTVDQNITILIVGEEVPAGGGSSCLTVDTAKLIVTHIPEATDFCQSSTLAPITLTNAGNTDINIDANFSGAFLGNDLNTVLKVWQGSSGCGADGNGMGGWQQDCTYFSPIDTNTAPNTTTCRQYTKTNAQEYGRIATQLTAESTQQICFSGDFNYFVNAGDHNGTFNACAGNECQSDVTDSLLGWWKMNEGSGTVMEDSTVYNNDGELKGTPTWKSGTACANGGCLDFNSGQTTYVQFVSGIDFNFGSYDAMTVSFWLKPRNAGAGQYIMNRGATFEPFRMRLDSGILFDFQASGSSLNGDFGASVLADGLWHHMVMTYDASDGTPTKAYVDGVAYNTYGEPSGTICVNCAASPPYRMFLGAADNAGVAAAPYYDGLMDDIRFYSRALTEAEIKAVFAHPQ